MSEANEYSYLPPDDVYMGKETVKDKMYDALEVGIWVIGLRAIVEPEKYGDSEFIQRAVREVEYRGWVSDKGIHAPAELMDYAFPSTENNQLY